MINRLLANNGSAKFIALLLALLIWGVAFSEEQPISSNQALVNDSRTFHDIPINLLGPKEGFHYLLSFEAVESVTLSGPTAWMEYVSSLGANVDLSQISEEGEYIVEVFIEKPERLRVTACHPTQVTVYVEAFIEQEFTIYAEYSGALAPGFYLHTYPSMLPDRVFVEGLRSDVEAIFTVNAVLDLEESDVSLVKDISLSLKGYSGEMLLMSNYTLSPSVVRVNQEVVTRVDLAIQTGEILLPQNLGVQEIQVLPELLSTYVVVERLSAITDLTLQPFDFTSADDRELRSWGLGERDPLYLILQQSEEILPQVGDTFWQDLQVILTLPPGVSWANSVPGTPVEITLRMLLELLPEEEGNVNSDPNAEQQEMDDDLESDETVSGEGDDEDPTGAQIVPGGS